MKNLIITASKKIKVVHLVSDLSIGGVQKVVLDICSTANLDKFEVVIFALNPYLDLLSSYELDARIKIEVFSYDYDKDFSLRGYLKNSLFKSLTLKKSRALIEAAVKFKPDILHCHLHPKELNIGVLIQKRTGCKLVYTQHMQQLNLGNFKVRLLGLIYRLTFRKYNIIAVSEGIRNDILRHRLLGKNRELFLIENKINLQLYKPEPKIKKDEVIAVYVARIGFPKAHEDLIKAWGLLIDEPVSKKLLLIGPDAMDGKMQELAEKVSPDRSIVFMGAQYDIAGILRNCDFAVFPSHKEGLPVSLLEKMAMKLPVVASDIPELTSIVKDKENGLIFVCGDVEDLAEKMKILINNFELRLKMGERARQTVEDKFGSSNIAFANELAYQKLLNLT